MCKDNFEFDKLKKTTFDQKEYLIKFEEINSVFMDLVIRYKESEYINYTDTYYKKFNTESSYKYKHKKMKEKEWNKEAINKWTSNAQYEFIDDECYEFWLNDLNDEYRDRYCRFMFSNKEIDICVNFDNILKIIINNFRVEDKYEEIERLLDEIIDNLFKLSDENKKFILDIHKNKIKNLHEEVMKTINGLDKNEKKNFDIIYPRRLSEEETTKIYLEELTDML